MQITLFIPFDLSWWSAAINPGKCLLEHVGVKAPGMPNNITFSSPITCLIDVSLGLSSKVKTFASGSVSPFFALIFD